MINRSEQQQTHKSNVHRPCSRVTNLDFEQVFRHRNMIALHRSSRLLYLCSEKYMLLKISQNSQENTRVCVSFNKVAGLRHATLLKKIL